MVADAPTAGAGGATVIRLVLDNLTKRVDELAVVDGIALDARPGELVVVLGPSGAGKTTLARLIAGLETPDAGEIYFNGRVMNGTPAAERGVGMVFQADALWPHLTVAENVALALRPGRDRRERKRRVEELLDRARIDTLANKRPEALSDLQRQRLAIARALAGDPDLLILDEPLDPLGGRARDDFREEVRQWLAEAEVTALVLTRDPRAALAMAERLAVMDLGRVVQFGPPTDVYCQPVDAVVAQLLGPVNLLQGQIEGTDPRGDLIVRTPLGRLLGRAPQPLADGSLVSVAVRPESLLIAQGTAVPADANRFAATVERLEFLGEARRVSLRGPGDWPIQALSPQVQSRGLREGQSLTIMVHPDQVVVMAGRHAAPR